MSFFKFSKFSKFFVCFVFGILFFGVQARCMNEVYKAFDMFNNISVPEVCEICKKNKPVYILTDDQLPGDAPSSSLCVCCSNTECIQRYMENFVLKYQKIMFILNAAVPEIASKFKDHEQSSMFRVLRCLNRECKKCFVSGDKIPCPTCGSNCAACFIVRSINDEDNVRCYKLFNFFLEKLGNNLHRKIFLLGESDYSCRYDNKFIAKLLASVMKNYTYQELKRNYQILAIGKPEGQVVKGQFIGTFKKFVLILKDEGRNGVHVGFCEKSNCAKRISELSKEGYNVLYDGQFADGNVSGGYSGRALAETGLLNNLIIDSLK